VGVEAGGRGNPGIQFDLPQLSPSFVAVGILAKCVVVFVSCHG